MTSDDTIHPITNSSITLSALVRALADDVERVSGSTELQQHAPTEGRVAEISAGTPPYDVYIGTGDAWVAVASDLGLTTAISRTTPQDLTAGDAPAPAENGVEAVHDGTGTPVAGSYVSDPANNQWVGADDLTTGTTIAY
ncbi:hypothetical protein C453_12921 [Haloferax elongans ATCC BAA-1513]|uniref:Uncharacterized protein n=1 Tax=Haloferax elongans ATCC BAA-1513 TaxID=1230453 RepID=M0HMW9_HALEO|nr:hypothetical protein [Haloferax elongans]ELZ84449.1 hypothetical protein C453_12921 [Haloferax elongans ATCC BAA-1513]